MTTANQSPGSTSDLSVDEILLLDSINWEPVDLVCGVEMNIETTPQNWTWAVGEVGHAWLSQQTAFARAVKELTEDCRARGGHGVVGVNLTVQVLQQGSRVYLEGTAVRPRTAAGEAPPPFVSDLSARDFVLLDRAGYRPLGLAFGAAFVHAPRQGAGTAVAQHTRNVELTTFTQTLYQARDLAMTRMQDAALSMQANGVVAVHVDEGPVHFARHCTQFRAWGTAIAPGPDGHQYLRPRVVMQLNDREVAFNLGALGG